MAIKVGGSYVSETAYAQAKVKIEGEINSNGKTSTGSYLTSLQEKYKGMNISSNVQPYSGSGTNNIGISSRILNEMANNPDKRLEYEALMIDCQTAEKSLSSAFASKGLNLVSHGFIIGADGGLSSWSVVTSGDSNTKSTFNSYLDKSNKSSWYDTMMKNLTNYKSLNQYGKYGNNTVDYKA